MYRSQSASSSPTPRSTSRVMMTRLIGPDLRPDDFFGCELRRPAKDAIDRGLIRTHDIFPYVRGPIMHHGFPPTSSVATRAGRRATVVRLPTARPIVAALPMVAVTSHYRS